MPEPPERRGPDLRVARRYLEGYVEPDGAAVERPTWLPLYAWPSAIILLLVAIVSWAALPNMMTESATPDPVGLRQGYDDLMNYLMLRTLLLGIFSAALIALNVAVLFFERTRPSAMKLVDASCIVIPLLVLLSLLFSPVPLGVQFHP